MLQVLRSKSASIVAKFLFALLVLSFGAWGVGDIFTASPQDESVASVGSVDIPSDTLAREFQRDVQQARQLFGPDFSAEQARQIGFLDRALNRLIGEALLDLQAKRMGVAISDELVRATIQRDPMFRDQSDRFDPALFRSVLFNNSLTEDQYVALLRRDLARRQVLTGVTGFDVVPETLAENLYRHRNQTRIAESVVVPASAQDIEEPGEDELLAYYEDNIDLFMAPEYRNLAAIVLTPETLLPEIHVEEERVRAEYEARRRQYTTPEVRHAEQVIVDDPAVAERMAEAVAAGTPFADAAQEIAGQTPIDLGEVVREELGIEALETAVFETAEGGVSAPARSPLGWHVVHVGSVVPGSVRPFEEVADELRRELALELARDDIVDLANRLDDELGGGANLEEAAATLGLDIVRFLSVDDTGNTPSGERAQGLPDAPEFLGVAFREEVGVESLLNETDNGYFVVRVNSVTDSQPRPFAEVREAVAEAVRDERREARAEAEANEILERLRGGSDIASVAAENGLPVTTSPPLTREDRDTASGMSAAATAALFELDRGEAGIAPASDGFTVFRLREIRQPAVDAAGEEFTSLRKQTSNDLRNDLLQQIENAFRTRYDVTVDRAALDGIL